MTVFLAQLPLQSSKGKSLSRDVKYMGVGKICDFQQKSQFTSETVKDRPAVTMAH